MKKIAVCHDKSCGPAGAERLCQRLKNTYAGSGIDVVPRTCCGRCEHSISIEVDDDVIISDLSLANLEERFTNDPDAAIQLARKEREEMFKKIDTLLENDLV